MKKIGFIDYYLSEWHANNYPKWFKEINKSEGLDYAVAYAYADIDVSPVDNVTSSEWAEKFGVTLCASIEEICAKSDYLVILAPSNPEMHLSLCERTFKNFKGGYIYIDKTFAPDLDTAKKIFALAEENDVKFFSTSALRYCSDLCKLKKVNELTVAYWGEDIAEYIIHEIESVVKVMKGEPKKLKAEKEDSATIFEIVFADGRKAIMNFSEDNKDNITVTYENGQSENIVIAGDCFTGLAKAILNFFETKTIDFDGKETLQVIAIRDKAIIAKDNLGKWFDI